MAHSNKLLLVYVAGPFRAETDWDVEQNAHRAESWGMKIAELGAMPVIPHRNNRHTIGTKTEEFWIEGTLELMRRCDFVFLIPGWRESGGAVGEHVEAKMLGIPNTDQWDTLSGWVDAFNTEDPDSLERYVATMGRRRPSGPTP